MLLLVCNGEVLLEKRPPTGVWGGLWCFPEIAEDAAREERPRRETGPLPVLRHEFTHFTLDITPVARFLESASFARGASRDSSGCPVEEAVGAAVPAPVRKLLAGLASGRLLGQPAALEKALKD